MRTVKRIKVVDHRVQTPIPFYSDLVDGEYMVVNMDDQDALRLGIKLLEARLEPRSAL